MIAGLIFTAATGAVGIVIAAAVACGPVSEQEWDAACRRGGWQPSDEEDQVRT